MRMQIIGVVLTAVLVGCESGSSAPPTEPPAGPPGISIAASRSGLIAPRGFNAIVDFSITRSGNFAQAVEMSVEGLPRGVTAAFSTTTLSSAATSTRLNIEVDTTAAYGIYTLTIRGAGQGVSAVTSTVLLEVPRGTLSMTLGQIFYSTSVQPNFIASIPVSVVRANGFRGAVSLSASGLPAGVTLINNTISALGTTTNVSMVMGASVPAGTYPVTIRATGDDIEPQMQVVTIVVPTR